jgi:hypothetical protein
MILGVGDRVRKDAEIVGRMKILDDETVERDESGKRKTRDIVDYIGEDCRGCHDTRQNDTKNNDTQHKIK